MLAKELNKLMIDKGMRKGELAALCGWTSSNLYNKMKRDNFSEKELRAMADALGYELKIEFVPKKESDTDS